MMTDLFDYFAKLQLAKRKVAEPEPSDQTGMQTKKINDISNLKLNTQQFIAGKLVMPSSSDATFLSILNNGCARKGWTVRFETLESNEISENFTMRCTVSDMVALGKAKSKKAAKQMAAREILSQVVNRNELVGFDLGLTREEAAENLNKLSAKLEADDDVGAASAENWVGKLSEHCSRVKMNIPDYTYEEKTEAQGHFFVVTCTLGSEKTVGEAKQKKIAKTLAAREMFLKTQEIGHENFKKASDYTEKPFPTDRKTCKFAPSAETSSAVGSMEVHPSEAVANDHDLKTSIDSLPSKVSEESFKYFLNEEKAILSKVFTKQELTFMVFDRKTITNEVQCLLQLATPDKEIRVFPGSGPDLQQAKDCACNKALLYAKILWL